MARYFDIGGISIDTGDMVAKHTLRPRRLPVQKRAVERTRQIFDTTAKLLDQVGIDDLTTILIAKEMGISVGSLYHYFPNKLAILHGLGAQWLDAMTVALEDLEQRDLSTMSVDEFVDVVVERLLFVYRNQRAILPLMQALHSIPELRELDEEHDEMVVSKLAGMFRRVGMSGSNTEIERIAWVYLEMTHSTYVLAMELNLSAATRTISDMKRMAVELLRSYF